MTRWGKFIIILSFILFQVMSDKINIPARVQKFEYSLNVFDLEMKSTWFHARKYADLISTGL